MFSPEAISAIPAMRQCIEKNYRLVAIYPYHDPKGHPLFARVRLEHPKNGKTIRPVRMGAGDVLALEEPSFPKGRKPLYNLHLLTQHPAAHAWVVEGEKCADALNAFFVAQGRQTEHVATTSGSATSAEGSDCEPLRGREVTLWPDGDDAGAGYANAVAECLQRIGCDVATVDAASLGLSEGEDCADWLPANLHATLAELLVLPSIQPYQEVEILRMSDVVMKPVQWLWPHYIACGKISVIAGNPGLGKSQLTANLAATVTQGLGWPETLELAPQGNVIFLSAEDDPADTIAPRLMAAGADLSRCHMLEAVRIPTSAGEITQRSLDLSQDIARLGQAIRRIGNVRMVVIDPITAYLGNTDSNNNAEIRGLLTPLAALAMEHEVAILALTHLNKSNGQDILARVIGSIGLIAAARAGFAVVKDPHNPALRYFLPIKNNIGNDSEGFTYTIEGSTLDQGIETSRIVWKAGMVNAHTILNPLPEEKPTATNGAKGFLQEILDEGAKPAATVFEEAEGAGYSKSSVQRAARALGVQRKKRGMEGGWEWSLPTTDYYGNRTEDAEDTEDCTLSEAASSFPSLQPS